MIATHDLTKRYGGVLALDRLAVEIPEGAVFGLLGPNGSGKSTLDAPAVAWTVLYALVLYLGATLLFSRKDLLWAE